MLNIKYQDELLTDAYGWPRDFNTMEDVESYLGKYPTLDRGLITIEDIGSFEFELPGNIRNHCKFGYLRDVQAFSRKIGRYRQLQQQFEELGKWYAYQNHERIVVDLYEDSARYSFYWVAHYDHDSRTIMNGGLIFHKDPGLFREDGTLNEDQLPVGDYVRWSVHT